MRLLIGEDLAESEDGQSRHNRIGVEFTDNRAPGARSKWNEEIQAIVIPAEGPALLVLRSRRIKRNELIKLRLTRAPEDRLGGSRLSLARGVHRRLSLSDRAASNDLAGKIKPVENICIDALSGAELHVLLESGGNSGGVICN